MFFNRLDQQRPIQICFTVHVRDQVAHFEPASHRRTIRHHFSDYHAAYVLPVLAQHHAHQGRPPAAQTSRSMVNQLPFPARHQPSQMVARNR